MSDLNLIDPKIRSKGALALARKGCRRLMLPWLSQLDMILREVIKRIDHVDSVSIKAHEKGDRISERVDDLTEKCDHLEAAYHAYFAQLHAVASSFPGVDARLDFVEEKLNAFEALHWDHIALTRRLAAIEDALALAGDGARAILEEGHGRPLLPFPGLGTADSRPSKVS